LILAKFYKKLLNIKQSTNQFKVSQMYFLVYLTVDID